ncbi:MAG: transketolase family protein [Armatimonadota bacterium]|nr:transketolase family protein [Armatimonadota bacterium]
MPEMLATRKAYGQALVELGRENPNVVVLDCDLSKSTMTNQFAKEFPERFINMGIAEANMMATAAGLAACGKIAFTSTFAVFATGRAWEQARMSIGYTRMNVKIAATHAGVTVGEDGASHQANEDIALMRVIPNFTVIVPADAVETRQAVHAAARHAGPAYIRLGRADVPVIFDDTYRFEIGSAVVMREGTDISLFACGGMVAEALKAADILAAEGISAEVVNVSTIKPLDVETIVASVRKTGAAVSAEEHTIIGGLGGAISEALAEEYPVPMKRVGIEDCFGESGTSDELLCKYCMTGPNIADAARIVLARKPALSAVEGEAGR